jgi:hypothetical protein
MRWEADTTIEANREARSTLLDARSTLHRCLGKVHLRLRNTGRPGERRRRDISRSRRLKVLGFHCTPFADNSDEIGLFGPRKGCEKTHSAAALPAFSRR